MQYPTDDWYDPDTEESDLWKLVEQIRLSFSKMRDRMDLQPGDVIGIRSTDEVLKVTSIRAQKVKVTDPTVANPRDARADDWQLNMVQLYADWLAGNAVPMEQTFQPATPDPGADVAPEQRDSIASERL